MKKIKVFLPALAFVFAVFAAFAFDTVDVDDKVSFKQSESQCKEYTNSIGTCNFTGGNVCEIMVGSNPLYQYSGNNPICETRLKRP